MVDLPSFDSNSNSLRMPAATVKDIGGSPAWTCLLNATGEPSSWPISSAISPARAVSPAAIASRYLARLSGGVCDQPANASRAARTALSTSDGVPAGTEPYTLLK
jgi:hypothetical protein